MKLMKKVMAFFMAVTMIGSTMGVRGVAAKAADYTITEASLSAQRLDVVCIVMDSLEKVYKTAGQNFMLSAVDETSGYYVNGTKKASAVEYTQWGLHPTATIVKGQLYAPGDYLEIMGTFTEKITNKTYQIDLHAHCISGSGTGVTSTAEWELLSADQVPDFSAELLLNFGYQKMQKTQDGWKLTVNTTPSLSGTGIVGNVDVTLKNADGTGSSTQSVQLKAGEVDSELYLEFGEIANLQPGMKLMIAPCTINGTVLLSNTLEVIWDGSDWTDRKNLNDIIGDANEDGELNVKDVVRYKRALAGVETFPENYVSDLNKDAKTDEFDTLLTKKLVLGGQMKDIIFDCTMYVTSPEENEIVYPYTDRVYQFLTTEGADIRDYYVSGTQPGRDGSLKDIYISWEEVLTEEMKYAGKYVVEYATKEDFSNALSVAVKGDTKNVGINNLYKATDYYMRVTAYAGNVQLGQTETITFKTTDVGPRVMTVDGIYNVRDLGGYMTESGKRTVQGLLYRGGEMDGTHGISLTEKGNETMSSLMSIKYDMDFRQLSEANYATESPISSATKKHHIIGGYTSVFDNNYKEEIREIFSTLADADNYPIYFHCWGGADRTGTIAFLVNGLCGVSRTELIQDYEFTSYSVFGIRAEDSTEYRFADFLSQLETYEGGTLSAKIENFLLSIGVTADEIYNIKAIMFGEATRVLVSCAPQYDRNASDSFELRVIGGGEIASIYIEDTSVPYTQNGSVVTISGDAMPSSLKDGATVTGKIVFKNGDEKTFSFLYSYENIVYLSDYWTTDTGSLIMNTTGTVTGGDAVGYGKKIHIDMQSDLTGSNGRLRVAVGSYGFELRGGEFRLYTLSNQGVWEEKARYTGMNCPNDFFDATGASLIMQVSIEDNVPLLYIKASNGSSTKEYTYSFSSGRIQNEIATEAAKVSFYIDTSEIATLTVKTGVANAVSNLSQYWSTADGTVVLNESQTQASSDQAVGYDKRVRIDLLTERTGQNGDLYIMLGSYGVRLRGGLSECQL